MVGVSHKGQDIYRVWNAVWKAETADWGMCMCLGVSVRSVLCHKPPPRDSVVKYRCSVLFVSSEVWRSSINGFLKLIFV